MRDLIDKLTLLESGGTLSIPAIARSFKPVYPDKLVFEFVQRVNLPLDLKEGPATITQYKVISYFEADKNGHLKYSHPADFAVRTSFATEPTDNEDNREIIVNNAIKTLNQMFGIDVDSIGYNCFIIGNDAYVVFPGSEEFLALIDAAYQWRQEMFGDLP